VALGNDRYLCTDGSRGLTVFQIAEKMWLSLPRGADRPTLELKDRIIAPPQVVPPTKSAPAIGGLGAWAAEMLRRPPEVEVCVADSGGVVSLLALGGDGSLKVKREWALKGQIRSGPIVRMQGSEVRLGCVVERKKDEQWLVWLDPHQNGVCWEHRASDGAIVGQPEMAEGLLILADQSGRYLAIDPQTGKAVGPGYVLKGSIAPAASPVAFGPNRLFAPLSDGTVLMLTMNQLRKP
jgi:hypothetical protein